MSDANDVTCAHFALGEFTVQPRSLHDENPPPLLAGRYEVGRLVGSGGTARVYRAVDLRLEREVAVKIYDRDVVALDQRRRLREMSIQGSITHPGVVALLDSGTEHGRTYLVMQLVEGENLAERLLGGPMPVPEVTALADGLAEALAHVHARRVVHRDLKPANVFLSADGPLIGDFGIAHALDTTHITGTGVVPGTAAYLAPEQVGGERAGPPADVYALGLILLECATGRREYPGTMVEAAMARLTRAPRIPEGLPPSLAHTLQRMTHRDPADRPTAEEVRQLLHKPAPARPWATERRGLAAAGVLRRWHRAAPGDRGRRGRFGAVGRNPGPHTGDPGYYGPLAPIPGHHGPSQPEAGTEESGSRDTLAPSPGHHSPLAPTMRDTGVPHRPDPAGPRRMLVAAGLSPASLPAQRRRFTAAAGLTAAAVAAVSAMLLSSQEPGTSTPAQPPAPSSPASTRPSEAPLAGSGTPDPSPRATESAELEPAAVTHERQAAPKAPKPVKPPKPETHGKGKGKGPGHD
ncbi:serine/threonine-protein kinase [Amycolatopsis sp. NPDC048633]|uniref:serine/threonine-protein kinase n=1 Tax=Amycolatopsis sp. NPDC048633 TaxID=3157095 RepID=UPI0033F34055